jgi:hypothetical protein
MDKDGDGEGEKGENEENGEKKDHHFLLNISLLNVGGVLMHIYIHIHIIQTNREKLLAYTEELIPKQSSGLFISPYL